MSVRLVSFFALFAIVCGCFTGCDAVLDAALSNAEAMSDKEVAKLEDQRVESALKGKNEDNEVCVPMSEFFANPQKYKLWAGDPAAFKSLGEKCVAAGATGAYAIVIQEDQLQMTDSFAIALPADKAARTKVFEAYNQFWRDAFKVPAAPAKGAEDEETESMREELEYYLAKDLGQKYITFSYDD
jgi:hypothetical protein